MSSNSTEFRAPRRIGQSTSSTHKDKQAGFTRIWAQTSEYLKDEHTTAEESLRYLAQMVYVSLVRDKKAYHAFSVPDHLVPDWHQMVINTDESLAALRALYGNDGDWRWRKVVLEVSGDSAHKTAGMPTQGRLEVYNNECPGHERDVRDWDRVHADWAQAQRKAPFLKHPLGSMVREFVEDMMARTGAGQSIKDAKTETITTREGTLTKINNVLHVYSTSTWTDDIGIHALETHRGVIADSKMDGYVILQSRSGKRPSKDFRDGILPGRDASIYAYAHHSVSRWLKSRYFHALSQDLGHVLQLVSMVPAGLEVSERELAGWIARDQCGRHARRIKPRHIQRVSNVINMLTALRIPGPLGRPVILLSLDMRYSVERGHVYYVRPAAWIRERLVDGKHIGYTATGTFNPRCTARYSGLADGILMRMVQSAEHVLHRMYDAAIGQQVYLSPQCPHGYGRWYGPISMQQFLWLAGEGKTDRKVWKRRRDRLIHADYIKPAYDGIDQSIRPLVERSARPSTQKVTVCNPGREDDTVQFCIPGSGLIAFRATPLLCSASDTKAWKYTRLTNLIR